MEPTTLRTQHCEYKYNLTDRFYFHFGHVGLLLSRGQVLDVLDETLGQGSDLTNATFVFHTDGDSLYISIRTEGNTKKEVDTYVNLIVERVYKVAEAYNNGRMETIRRVEESLEKGVGSAPVLEGCLSVLKWSVRLTPFK